MLQQLMLMELLVKGGAGVVLLLIPGSAARLFGMPPAGSGFWPRLLGGLLVSLALALLLQLTYPAVRTITPAGLITMNLTVAATLAALIVLKRASDKRRGTTLLWLIAGSLVLLSLVEISVA